MSRYDKYRSALHWLPIQHLQKTDAVPFDGYSSTSTGIDCGLPPLAKHVIEIKARSYLRSLEMLLVITADIPVSGP